MAFRSVVFPHPDGPTIMQLAGAISREQWSTAVDASSYRLDHVADAEGATRRHANHCTSALHRPCNVSARVPLQPIADEADIAA